MTSDGALETAVTAMRGGACDYLKKPLNLDELIIVIERAIEQRMLKREASLLRQRLAIRDRVESMVGKSEPMLALAETIRQVFTSKVDDGRSRRLGDGHQTDVVS